MFPDPPNSQERNVDLKNKMHCLNPRKHICEGELPPQLQVCNLFGEHREQRQGENSYQTPKRIKGGCDVGTFDL